jgi:hypothetical protein
MSSGTQSAFQHDARRHQDGTISIFDNGAHPKVHDQSRGIVVELDEEKMSAKLVREYTWPKKPLATSQGNMQLLPNANVFIGWGSAPLISEFSYEGKLSSMLTSRPTSSPTGRSASPGRDSRKSLPPSSPNPDPMTTLRST